MRKILIYLQIIIYLFYISRSILSYSINIDNWDNYAKQISQSKSNKIRLLKLKYS